MQTSDNFDLTAVDCVATYRCLRNSCLRPRIHRGDPLTSELCKAYSPQFVGCKRRWPCWSTHCRRPSVHNRSVWRRDAPVRCARMSARLHLCGGHCCRSRCCRPHGGHTQFHLRLSSRRLAAPHRMAHHRSRVCFGAHTRLRRRTPRQRAHRRNRQDLRLRLPGRRH